MGCVVYRLPYFSSSDTACSSVVIPASLFQFALYIMDLSGAASVAKDAVCCRTFVGSLRSYNFVVDNNLNCMLIGERKSPSCSG